MNPNICVFVNFLMMNESTRRMWSELARLLAKSQVQLVMLSTAPSDRPLPFPVIQIPFLLRDYVTHFPHLRPNGAQLTAQDWELLEADSQRASGAYAPADAMAGLFTCRKMMENLLKILEPGYVLTWDSTCPLAIIVQDLCHKNGWPVQTLERGLLPETLMIESRGIQALSDLRTHWMAQEMPESARDEAAFERIREYYLARKPQKYDQPSFNGGGENLRKQLDLGDKKAVVFFGQYDPCGFAPPDSLMRRGHSPVFRSTEDTLISLSAVLRHHPETALIFKPHPLDRNPYSSACNGGVQMLKSGNVHALIDLADIVVAQFTTLQFEAALYDKPVVLAARSAWWGRGATYEVHRREDLSEVVFAALHRQDWTVRCSNARAFLTWIMDSWLISDGSGAPARRTLGDFAEYLAQTALDSGSLASVGARVRAMNELLRKWRFGPLSALELASQKRAAELFRQTVPAVRVNPSPIVLLEPRSARMAAISPVLDRPPQVH
jgi:hypothetical protein